MDWLNIGVSHCSCTHTVQVSREHRQVFAYRQAKERSGQIQERPAVAPLGMVPWNTAEKWGWAANGRMFTLDPNTTNTNAGSARILLCYSHCLSLLWWWSHPVHTSWMMQPGGSVYPNTLIKAEHPPSTTVPSSVLSQQASCSPQFLCS